MAAARIELCNPIPTLLPRRLVVLRTLVAITVLAGGLSLFHGATGAAARAADGAVNPAAPVVILKLDDVVQFPGHGGPVSPRWKRVADFVEKNHLKAGFGIICSSLERDNPAYFDWIKEHQKKGSIEFWLHGYHNRTASETVGEFDRGTKEEQQAILEKSERLAKEKLGFPLAAFGPHWSGTTEQTDAALEAVPEIKIWLYGPKSPKFYKRLSLERVMALENPTFVPDFEKFKASYEKVGCRQKVLVLQGHANIWDDARWAGFVKIVELLQSKGCRFTTPSEYLASCGGG
jgi:peptidoglycan/xylan/chitin deacetylase (PgdA/CDA1 family)